MEELFQYMKTFRSQINDVADQAAKISVEEHMQGTTIQALQKDLDLVKNETRKVKEETDQMAKAKGQICLQILEKQRKFASYESDSDTLCKTLMLMQQEISSLSAKLVEKSAYYTKVTEDILYQLNEQQEWLNAQKFGSQAKGGLVNEKAGGTKDLATPEFLSDVDQSMMMNLQAAQTKFDNMEQQKSELLLENSELRQTVELARTKMADFKPELREMNEKSLDEELQALLSDKAGEAEYVQSLQRQIATLKLSLLFDYVVIQIKQTELTHKVRCSCGEEYNVQLDT